MNGWTFAWIFRIVMFFVIEFSALFTKRPEDTLSQHIWRWFSIKDKSPGYRYRRFALLAGLVWLVAHLLTGGWV